MTADEYLSKKLLTESEVPHSWRLAEQQPCEESEKTLINEDTDGSVIIKP